MPRYIDADKLFTWLRDKWKDKYPVGDGGQFDTVSIYEIKQEIDDAETVDAIPVEFIEKRMKELGDYEESWNLRGLIEDWRKENETD